MVLRSGLYVTVLRSTLWFYVLRTLWFYVMVLSLEATATVRNVTKAIFCTIFGKSSKKLGFIDTTTNASTNH